MTTVLPRVDPVTPERVVRVTRVLFVVLGALLGPVAACWMFGADTPLAAWGSLAMVTPLLCALVAGRVVRGPSTVAAVCRVMAWSILAGMVNGVLCGEVWAVAERSQSPGFGLIVALFGVIYGALYGAAFGVVFAAWTALARGVLRAPSALAALRLRVHAGLFLALGGVVGACAYRFEVFQRASTIAFAVGLVTVVSALVAMGRMSRFARDVVRGALPGVRIVPWTGGTDAPALAWVAPMDHVVEHVPEHGDGVPFRETLPIRTVAMVDADLTQVRRAIRATTVYSLGLAALVGLLGLGAAGYLATGRVCAAVTCTHHAY